jgi:hypothetical protein
MVETTAVLLAGGAETLDLGDDGLPVGVPEGRVVDQDVHRPRPLLRQVGLEDLVGGARVDIVGPGQHPALHTLLAQVVHGGDRLLVRRRAGVEDVARRLLPLVLHRVEQQAVQFLEHRQHGFARDRGPAAEHNVDLLPHQQLARFLGEQRPVGSRVDDDGLEGRPSRPPFAFCSSTSISTVSFSVVSLIAMVPGQGMQHADPQRRRTSRGLGNHRTRGLQQAECHAHADKGPGQVPSIRSLTHGRTSLLSRLGTVAVGRSGSTRQPPRAAIPGPVSRASRRGYGGELALQCCSALL